VHERFDSPASSADLRLLPSRVLLGIGRVNGNATVHVGTWLLCFLQTCCVAELKVVDAYERKTLAIARSKKTPQSASYTVCQKRNKTPTYIVG